MKKFTYILIALLVISTGVYAQGQMDALRFSQNDMFGTARAMGMGGAFGALGGDQTGVSINPAGIAVYRSNEITATFQFMSNAANVDGKTARRGTFDMPNIGLVAYFPLRSHVMPFINVGFTYGLQQSFNRRTSASGELNSSLLDFIADRSFGLHASDLIMQVDGNNNVTLDPFSRGAPWLPALAASAQLMNPGAGGVWTPVNTTEKPFAQINMTERGFIDNFGFTLGTTINHVLSIGASLSVSSISYRLDSDYDEDFSNGGYTLTNMLTVDGTGVSGRFGLIYSPIHELRLGVSYQTPTRFALTETFRATIDQDMVTNTDGLEWLSTGTDRNEFDLRTPGRWIFSAAGILGDFIISADYEITNFGQARLLPSPQMRLSSDWFDYDNEFIQTDFRTASTLRLGIDYRVTPQLSLRAGYIWQQNPIADVLRDNGDPVLAGSNHLFVIEGDANTFTAGIGYRFNRHFFLDFAMMYRTQTNQLYAFPNFVSGDYFFDATPFDMRNTSLRGMLTLGYRF